MESARVEREWNTIISPGYQVGDIADFEFLQRTVSRFSKGTFPRHWSFAPTDPMSSESDSEEAKKDPRARVAIQAKMHEKGFTVLYIDPDTNDILNFDLKEGKQIPSVLEAIKNRTLG